ncbi:hypothetical protein ACFE04_029375 [Oxalis oulophora]
MDRLPTELVFEIFNRVPIKSIGQSMCVSKQWLARIKTAPFISSYTATSSKIPSNQLLVSDKVVEEISFDRDSQGFESYKVLKVPFETDDDTWRPYLHGVSICLLSFCFRKNGELFLQVPWYDEDARELQKEILLLDPQLGEKKTIMKDTGIFCHKIFCFFESLVLLDHPLAQSY